MEALSTQIQRLHTHETMSLAIVPKSVMDRLPTELLIECFAYATHVSPLTPVRLSRVCRRWHKITARNPCIYHCISIDDSSFPLDFTQKLSEYYLRRSGTHPFDVYLNAKSRDPFLTLLTPFFPHLPRWRSCTIGPIEDWKEERVIFFGMWAPDVQDQFLEELSLNVVEETELEDIIAQFPPQDSNGEYPKMFMPRQPNNLLMSNVVSSLPVTLPTPLHITSLYLTDGPTYVLNVNINPIDMLHFLNCCPELEFLSFTGMMIDKDPRPEDVERGAPTANLPNLRSLVLHRTLCTRVILSYIYCPRLEELYLEHLNVDFEFPTHNPYLRRRPRSTTSHHIDHDPSPPLPELGAAIPFAMPLPASDANAPLVDPSSPLPNIDSGSATSYNTSHSDITESPTSSGTSIDDDPDTMQVDGPDTTLDLTVPYNTQYEEEEGDSDDESLDFSQSPFSDHATGMGLRSLINRCHPPLKVLEMDYADMRTKDFDWFFRKAHQLEEFRIVASDMSDRVMELIAPFEFELTPRTTPEPGEDDREDPLERSGIRGPRGEIERASSLPLPQLKRLELFNCQVVSGDAIVETLTSRCMEFDGMKRLMGEDTPWRRLEHVSVVGCGKFGQTHALDLRDALGSRGIRFDWS